MVRRGDMYTSIAIGFMREAGREGRRERERVGMSDEA
jgi:hypothetical protein